MIDIEILYEKISLNYTCRPNPKSFGIMASQMHKLNLGLSSQIPNVDQFPRSTNKHLEFVRMIYNPCVILYAYWAEEQVQGYDLHLGFGIWDAQINLGFGILDF